MVWITCMSGNSVAALRHANKHCVGAAPMMRVEPPFRFASSAIRP